LREDLEMDLLYVGLALAFFGLFWAFTIIVLSARGVGYRLAAE